MGAPTAALDIGGANLKAAHSDGIVLTKPFALWRNPAALPAALRELFKRLPPVSRLTITMTGELCDCFPDKASGVRDILDAVVEASNGIPIRVWQADGVLVSVDDARQSPAHVAAANWLALATFCARFQLHGTALLIDIGSTTADIIPIEDGRPVPLGRTDLERIRNHEMLYTGVRRTPVCSLMGKAGAAELFATMLDVYLILGFIKEDEHDCDTADGRPATRAAALTRLARMKCAEIAELGEHEVLRLAHRLAALQAQWIAEAVRVVVQRLPAPPSIVVTSGTGEFLARQVVADLDPLKNADLFSFADRFGYDVSAAACAFALMKIANVNE